MFSLTRKEQIVVCVLSGALVVGAAISYWDGRHPDAIQEFHVTPALKPPVDDSSRIEDVPFGDHKVDLNGATAQELEQLPGIGPKMAARLIAWREKHGVFRSVEDLKKVRGIGEKTFTKLAPLVKVEERMAAQALDSVTPSSKITSSETE